MVRRLATCLIVALFLISSLAPLADSRQAGTEALTLASEGTITVGSSGNYKTIQAAINAASPGSTILVSSGTYKECLTISKKLTVKAASGETPMLDCSGTRNHAVTISASGVRIEGFTIRNINPAYYGIMYTADSGVISNNNIIGGYTGICLKGNGNIVEGNSVTGEKAVGIYVYANNNILRNNDISGTLYGIRIYRGSGHVLTGNFVHQNNIGILLESTSATIYLNDITGNRYPALQIGGTISWTSNPITYTYKGKTYTNKLGNLYSSYTGQDTNSDGIGDTAYTNTYGIKDSAPLMASRTSYTLSPIVSPTPVPTATQVPTPTPTATPTVTPQPSPLPTPTPPPSSEYWLYDDFSAWNTSRWTKSSYVQSSFINTTFLPSNVWFADGKLVIRSDVNNSTGGELKSRSLFTYGGYRTSMKINQTPGTYINAFNYMWPGGNDGEKHNEVDFEFIKNKTSSYALLTTWYDGQRNYQLYNLTFDPGAAYHVYGYDWYKDHVDFFIDNILVWTSTSKIPNQPTWLYFNSWVVKEVPVDHGNGINMQYVDWVTVVPVDPSKPAPTTTPKPTIIPTVTPTPTATPTTTPKPTVTPTATPTVIPTVTPVVTPVPPGTITVGPSSNYKTIQAAINAATPGNTILVSTDTYNEAIIVNKRLTVKAANGATPIIDCTGRKITGVSITAAGASLEGFTIRNVDQGYSSILVKAVGCTIADNKIVGGYAGICVKSDNCTITGNTISASKIACIYAYLTNHMIKNNDLSGSTYGILTYGVSGSLLTGNNVHGNSIGIRLDYSKNNKIFLNDLLSNNISAGQTYTSNNWTSDNISYRFKDTTYNGKLGNKYSDYTLVDNNSDGIGDTPYTNKYTVRDTAPLTESRVSYTIV